ncbi:ketopantoate reductase family protein [Haloplanus sp. C73]|uniref:ketopantoate reductase family protein n=1 Tax=Haloplanus sp. C73 TaxID=3421641 RepID=UPI003EB6F751
MFGAGSLGSLVGGCLARTHDVTLVGRDPHVETVRQDGLRVSGVETFDTRPAATTEASGTTADIAIVTVKAYDTETAARTLATGEYGVVCSLQNGMGNEDTLAAHVDAPVVAGTATCGARLADPGHVEWLGRGTVTLGPWHSDDTAPVERVATAFRDGGLPADVTTDIRRRLWEKLAVNAAINPVTALARVENGALSGAGPLAELATAAARETAAVAREEGVDLSTATATDAVASVASETAANRSSMHRDISRGRRTEIDAINGFVVDRAAATGESVPVNRTLTALIRGWETGAGVRE